MSSRARRLLVAALALTLTACASDDSDDDPTSPEDSEASPSESSEVTVPPERTTPPKSTEVVARDLDVPWDITFLPDGEALVTLRDSAQIVRIADGQQTSAGTVPGVAAQGEGGLLGLAVSPDFTEDRTIYAYMTTAEDNRVVRMTWVGNGFGEPREVLSGIPSGSHHNGGRITFGPDGNLYVATGDAGDRTAAQNPDSLGGKILRITPEGDPAPGNPDPNSPVWTSGHRNVQGLAFREDGSLWASEFGQDTWDELNLIEKGKNYGWPSVEGKGKGKEARKRYTDPVHTWSPEEASPSGVTIDEKGDVIMAALRGKSLWRIPVTGDDEDAEAGEPERLLPGRYGRLRDVETGPDGSLWVLTSNTFRGEPRDGDDRVLRIPPSELE